MFKYTEKVGENEKIFEADTIQEVTDLVNAINNNNAATTSAATTINATPVVATY